MACQGRWTIIQSKGQCITSFNKKWIDYENGFGSLSTDLWLGNDLVSYLTGRPHKARFDLVTAEGESRYAHYDHFRVLNATQKYKMRVWGYSGDAGNGLEGPTSRYNANGSMFTTTDKDNDKYPTVNCADIARSGWWWNWCGTANLNGPCRNQTGYQCPKRVISCMHWKPLSWDGPPLMSSRIRIRRNLWDEL